MSQHRKILHVLGAMDIGGVESWLMNILRNTDQNIYKHEFLVHRDKKAFFDEEIYQLGSQKYVCALQNPIKYMINLYHILRKVKPDVVHSHVHYFSGLVLLVAWLAGVKIRISHSHTAFDSKSNLIKKTYFSLMRFLIKKFSTSQLAVSEKAAIALYGKNWFKDSRSKVIYCGIDYSRFRDQKSNFDYRCDLNIPKDAIVIGHVGRLEEPKNHFFMLDLMKKLKNIDKSYYLVLVGDGSLREALEHRVLELDLNDNIRFMGNRSDIPEIMCNLFDIFIFPSLWEGLPLTLIEAQFAKLTCLVSDRVTTECNISDSIYLPLESQEKWIEKILDKKSTSIQKNFDNNEFNLPVANKILNSEYQ